MPKPQNEDRPARDFIAHLIIANDDPTDLARFIGFQLLAKPGIIEQAIRGVRKLLNYASRSIGCHGFEVFVEAYEIRRSLGGPMDLHLVGEGSGVSVPRLSAHAWID